MPRLMFRILATIAIVLTASFAGAGAAAQDATPAAPVEPGALVNGVSVCPPSLEGASINPADCTEPAANVEFYAANPNTDNVAFGNTGGDGLVSFPLDQFAISPEGAAVEVGVILGSNPYGAVSGYVVGCTRNGEALDLEYVNGEVQPGGATLGVRFIAFPGDQVACEWFLSHVADNGDDGSNDTGDNDQSTGGPVTTLPSTGTGSETSGIDAAALGGVALLSIAGVAVALAASRRERTVER